MVPFSRLVAGGLLLLAGLAAPRVRAQQPPAWTTPAEAALAAAGTNRAELEAFLAQTPEPRRPGAIFLVTNMPAWDLRRLSAGFLSENLKLAYDAMESAPWAKAIPPAHFLNDVLPYASVTEDRDNWRAKMREISLPLVKDCGTASEAAQALNKSLFPLVKVKYSTSRRAPDQGPFETMRTGVATCTGLSILLVDACRSVGVPARLAGTPLWANNSGNHTWVEIWDGAWHFLGAAEPDPNGLDRGWFTGNASQAIANDRAHAIYAASFQKTGIGFPLSWEPSETGIPAVNVTDRYTASAKAADGSRMRLQINVLDRPVGGRVAAHVTVLDSADAAIKFDGTSKTEPSDLNDHLTFFVPRERTFIVESEAGGHKDRRFYSPGTNAQDVLTLYLAGVPQVTAPAAAMVCSLTPAKALAPKDEARLKKEATAFFTAPPDRQAAWKSSRALDRLLAGNETAARRAVWEAFMAAPVHGPLQQGFAEHKVRSDGHESPYTVKTVGRRPPNGWALFIAMHGGGGAPQELNDSQWAQMQRYYRDHPEAGGYLYVALRAPNNEWNGFYTGYVYPLIKNLINQFLLFGDVDPDKVFLMGYSHGGYGAFAIGPKMADRFAAVHASAAALADGARPETLRHTPFSVMVGEKDTAYGRIDRDREFAAAIEKLRGTRADIFPVSVTIIANHPHSGLPDRDKIAEMYPAVRNAVPRDLTWPLTDGVVRDFFWLSVSQPVGGVEIDAACAGNRVTVTVDPKLTAASVLLDSRLVDFSRPVVLECNGKTSKVTLKPSLLTLCRTLQQRGDPGLAFTAELPLPLTAAKSR